MKILASKNYPELSYMVDSEIILYNIICDEVIYTSEEKGYNGRFVSMSRDLTAPAHRNIKRWKYGVILDGSKLTDRYHIEPYSYAEHEYQSSRKSLVVKTITKYDNGECTLSLVNHPTKLIPKDLYDELKDLILSDSQGINELKHLQKHVGTRRRQGRMIVEQYTYNVPTGGLRLNKGVLSSKGASLLIHHTNLNETEERLSASQQPIINIHNCIVGVLIPKSESVDPDLEDLCEERGYRIQFY